MVPSGARWRTAQDRRASLVWAGEQLGVDPSSQLRVVHERARPWSWTAALETPRGRVWLKACARGTSQEVPLVRLLAAEVPDHVVEPLAADPDRHLLLLRDAGRTLREASADVTPLADWDRLLTSYGDLQRRTAAHVGRLLDLGVPDTRPAALPGRLDELRRRVPDPDLDALLPDVLRWCAELDEVLPLAAVQHDDLHDGNAFAAGEGEPPRVFDWGDASVGHPFAVLLVPLRVVASARGLTSGAPELLRLREAYLDGWASCAAPAALRRACELALRLAPAGRALSWDRALWDADADERREWGGGVTGWLDELVRGDGPLS